MSIFTRALNLFRPIQTREGEAKTWKELDRYFPTLSIGLDAVLSKSATYATAVLRIRDAISFSQPKVQNKTSKTEVPATHPLVKLLNRPNNIQTTFQEFLELTVTYWLGQTGSFAWLLDARNGLGEPTMIQVLNPVHLEPIKDSYIGVSGWKYVTPDGRSLTLRVEDVVVGRMQNPADPLKGLSIAGLAETEIGGEVAIAQHTKRLFQNGGTLGLVLESDKTLSPESVEMLKSQLEVGYSGTHNAHKPLVLEGGLKAKERTGQKEGDFIQTAKAIAEKILGVFGVPPILAGKVENANRSNSDTQERVFQLYTVQPLLKRLQSKLTEVAKSFNKGTLEVVFPEAVLRDDTAQADIANKYFNMGALTPNEVRARFLGMEKIQAPGMDETYIPASMLPTTIGDVGRPNSTPQVEVPVLKDKAKPKGEEEIEVLDLGSVDLTVRPK